MNAEKIADKMGRTNDSAGIWSLVQECAPRRAEIRARVVEISDASPPFPLPPERVKALRKGPAAIKELNDEIEALEHEYRYLDRLESELVGAHEAALDRELAAAFPDAQRSLRSSISTARDALAALDKAIAALEPIVNTLAQFERAKAPFPLKDRELAELLQLRADVWRPRTVASITPPGIDELQESYPLSWGLVFKRRGDDFTTRRAPNFLDPMDYTTSDNPLRGRR